MQRHCGGSSWPRLLRCRPTARQDIGWRPCLRRRRCCGVRWRAPQVELVAPRLELIDGRITGRFASANCWEPEKLGRPQAHVGGPFRLVAAYGASRGDWELLGALEVPFYRRFPRGIST